MAQIIIVDDESSVRDMLEAMIKPLEHELIVMSNADDVISACQTSEPDLVITDIVMPGKNGIDLIMTLKEKNPDIPIIAISGGGGITGRYDYLEIAKLVGADNIIKKPFTMENIRTAVQNILTSKEKV